MTQHTGDTINKLTRAVERAEERARWEGYYAEAARGDFERDIYKRCDEEDAVYPGAAFPGVEDAGDLQSMLDGLAAEHERGN